jgi:SpoIID/LytB domain protein
MGKPLGHAVLLTALVVASAWAADETSSGDKLRILYSNRFTFDDRGIPLVTVEIMGGQQRLELSSGSDLIAMPDGDGGAAIKAGKRWVVTLEDGRPARVREWTVVDRLEPDDDRAISRALARWKALGYRPRSFEIGSIFGVEGEVIDSREVLIGVAPVGEGKGARRASAIAAKHQVVTTVHHQLVERPGGTVVARSGGVEIRNPAVIWFAPATDGGTVTVADVLTGGGGSQLETKRETRRYVGSVYAAVGRDGKLVAVNAIAADQLLAGLVPSETFPDAPMEALKAQAVAARTELLEKIGARHFGDPYLLCSSQHCQVYSGAGKEHPRTTTAVTKTRGMVLMGEGGHLVDARYSASCGGHSEHNENIWGGRADSHLRGKADGGARSAIARFSTVDAENLGSFLAGAGDAHCARTKYSKGRYRWKVEASASELTRRITAHYPEVGTLRALRPLERGVSGRIRRIELRGSRGTAIAEGDLHIRRLLGGLRSSLFEVSRSGDRFVFRGAGFGHGVGMCQVGAIGMAEKRNSFRDILYHYYSGSRLKRLY